jgi:hypothetical protein
MKFNNVIHIKDNNRIGMGPYAIFNLYNLSKKKNISIRQKERKKKI